MIRRISFVILLILTLVVLTAYQRVSPQRTSFNGFALVDKTGNIRKPADFRDHYQLLGTWMILDPKGNQMHVTYASPGAAEYYRQNKKFADGTVLVKEIFATDHAQMTTGDAHRASSTIQWFIMIKDDKNRFPNNALWGDGWGWALFKADAPDKQVATDFKKDCLTCHIPAQSTDWVYVQGYPVLKSQ
jgi:Cytochrome P460